MLSNRERERERERAHPLLTQIKLFQSDDILFFNNTYIRHLEYCSVTQGNSTDLSKTLYPLLSTGSIQEDPSRHD